MPIQNHRNSPPFNPILVKVLANIFIIFPKFYTIIPPIFLVANFGCSEWALSHLLGKTDFFILF